MGSPPSSQTPLASSCNGGLRSSLLVEGTVEPVLVPRRGQVGPLSAREVAEARLEIGPRARKIQNGGAVAGVLGHQSGRHIFSLGE